MFKPHCAVCNVAVKPIEAEWSKHINGKQHKKRAVGSNLLSFKPVSVSNVVSIGGVTENGLRNLAYSTHSNKNEGHNVIQSTSSMYTSSSKSSSKITACNNVCLPALNGSIPIASSDCPVITPTLNVKTSLTAEIVSQKQTKIKQAHSETSKPSEPYLYTCQTLAKMCIDHFKPSYMPLDKDGDCVFSKETLSKLFVGMKPDDVCNIMHALPRTKIDPFFAEDHAHFLSLELSSQKKAPNFSMFCECCNVTCFSQADWNVHITSTTHESNADRFAYQQERARANKAENRVNARLAAMMHMNGRIPMPGELLCKEDDSDEYDSDDDDDYVYDYETEFAYWNMNNSYDVDFADGATDY